MWRASGKQEPAADAFHGILRGPSNCATINLPFECLQQGVMKTEAKHRDLSDYYVRNVKTKREEEGQRLFVMNFIKPLGFQRSPFGNALLHHSDKVHRDLTFSFWTILAVLLRM